MDLSGLPMPINRQDMYKDILLRGNISNAPSPVTRIDYYLKALIDGNKDNIPTPVSREDMYLAALISGVTDNIPTPVTRTDMYMYAIITGNIIDLPSPNNTTDYFNYNLALLYNSKTTSRIEENDNRITKVGTWNNWASANVSGGNEIFTTTTGSYIEHTFTGNCIRYISDVGDTNGIAKVTVDGVIDNVDLYFNTTIFKKVVFEKVLPYGQHTIRIEYTGNKNPNSTSTKIVLDCLEVANLIGGNVYKIEEEDARLVKTGSWQIESSPNYYDNGKGIYSNIAGSSITYTFTGSGIKYKSVKNANLGIVKITLDGVITEVDLYNPFLVKSQNVFDSGVLDTKAHTIKIEVTNRKNPSATGEYVILDNFEVTP